MHIDTGPARVHTTFMSASLLIAQCPPAVPASWFRDLLGRVAAFGASLADRLVACLPIDPIPSPQAVDATITRMTRILRALTWLSVLDAVFAGTWRPSPPAHPRAARSAAVAVAGSVSADSARPARSPRVTTIITGLRHAFATRPIGKIVAGLCRDLGIAPGTEAWPTELIALTATPAEWAATHALPPPDAPTAKTHTRSREIRRYLAAQARQHARHAPDPTPPQKSGHDPP